MTAIQSKTTNGLDPKKLTGVIDKMRDVQTEGDRWELADALKVMVFTGVAEFGIIIDAATREGVVGNLSKNTLRLYRDTSAKWPTSKRVPNVSFSAHREVLTVIERKGVDEAVKVFNDVSKASGGPHKVTVASVRKAAAIKLGKQPSAKQMAGKQNTTKQLDVLRDLEQHNGKALIDAIGNETDSDKLDRLNAGLTKVIAHVEKLRAKAAAKAKAPAKTQPASKPKVAAPAANGAKAKRPDIRDV